MNQLSSINKMKQQHDIDNNNNNNNDDDDHGEVQYSAVKCGHSARLEDLPTALLLEVLVRLPLKSAHQCKSVSKHWRSLISDPWFYHTFVRRQIYINAASPSLPFPRSSSLLPFMLVPKHLNNRVTGPHEGISLDFLPHDSSKVFVVGSCKDLLLCCFPHSCPITESVFYVCNPFTKHWVKLPTLISSFLHKHAAVGIITTSEQQQQQPDQYHVIGANHDHFSKPGPSLKLDVFSSETSEWTSIHLPITSWFQFIQRNGIVSNGKLHWLTRADGVFAFDPFACRYSLIDVPAELNGGGHFISSDNVRLGECRGRLRILRLLSTFDSQVDATPPPLSLTVWELKDYCAGEWCKVHGDIPMNIAHSDIRRLEAYTRRWPGQQQITLSMSVVFHPFDEDVVYLWLFDHYVVCHLASAEFQITSGNRTLLYHSRDTLSSLVQQFFPTPVTKSNSLHETTPGSPSNNTSILPKLENSRQNDAQTTNAHD